MLAHSKTPPNAIQEYLRITSRFMLDLVELSDLGSEASSELNLPNPVSLSYIVLENVLGLLENKLRRRSSFVVQSNILPLLGLVSAGIGASGTGLFICLSFLNEYALSVAKFVPAALLAAERGDPGIQPEVLGGDGAGLIRCDGRDRQLGGVEEVERRHVLNTVM